MTEQSMRTRGDTAPVVFELVDFSQVRSHGTVIVPVDLTHCDPSTKDLAAARNALLAQDFIANATFVVNNSTGATTFTLNLAPTDGGACNFEYLPEGRRETVLSLLSPIHLRVFAAAAEVVRQDRRHMGTIVTMSRTIGEPLTKDEFDAADLLHDQRVVGVGDALYADGMVKFSLDNTPLDDDGSITRIVQTVAAVLNGRRDVDTPVAVVDTDIDARLIPEFSYNRY